MRVLSVDPGAKRCGWAVIDDYDVTEYVASGIYGLKREENDKGKAEAYQKYRLRLIEFWVEQTNYLLDSYEPDVVVTEIVPAVGGGNFVAATQSQLAQAVATVIHAISVNRGKEISQVAANQAKRNVGGVKDASKAKVREGVIHFLPSLEYRRSEWVKIADEPDAIAIGLCAIGKKLEQPQKTN